MPEKYFILLDQGALRSPKLRQRIASDLEALFVVPDVAFSEMSIKRDPIQSMIRSLSFLRSVSERTFVSLSCGEIKELQRTGKTPSREDLLSGPGTRVAHALMQGESSADYELVVQRIRETAPQHREIYDARKDKAMMLDFVAIFSRNLGPSGLKALRANRITDVQKLGMIILIKNMMISVSGAFETETDIRMLIVRLARIMIWAERLGLQQVSDGKVMNDFIDMDFVVGGSYFNETMTCDKMVATLDRTLRTALDPEHCNHAAAAASAIGFRVKE